MFILIGHAINKLNANADYVLSISFGNAKDSMNTEITVLPFGVLQEKERDDKKCHAHEFGWSEEDRRWVKLQLVKLKDGTYALKMVLVKE